jgi:hypothetical protein
VIAQVTVPSRIATAAPTIDQSIARRWNLA